jgi:hypothetical protein
LFSRRAATGLPLDELLAAVVESLVTGLALSAAEVWTDTDGMLQLAASEPARQRRPLILRPAEAAGLERAGVVGESWLALWLPPIAAERDNSDVRAAAMVNAGELIGLLLAERGPGRPAFSRSDDDVSAS